MMNAEKRDPNVDNTKPVGSSGGLSPGRSAGRVLAGAFAGALSLLVLVGCTEYATDTGVNVPPEGHRTKQSIGGLAAGDVIKLNYPGAPELNLSQKIRGDGKISLPMIGDIVAGGKELTKFQNELSGLYKDHLQNPTVIVSLETTAAAVYVSGRVKTPTKVVLDRPMTVLEAVMEAGGFNEFAHPERTSVVRNEKGVHKRYNVNLTGVLSGETPAFYLKPFDIVYVQ